ncbi:alpha/beta fold hydrolase [Sphaerisporangium aureirubrum]|uniref:Alpha/beta fold hydrolase n=1 Tax=Sphaerisporangium aureirubrum TaxID=1544736 RepID=A0ABW1NQ40_9ACTN
MNAARSRTVRTDRLATYVRERGEGVPVLFVHGNLSDGSVWDEQLSLLPDGLHGIAPDLRGFGRSEAAPVDATRGLGDFRDDLSALLDALGAGATHLVGHSLGGGVVMDFAIHHPERVRTLTVVAPASPYGFGGTGAGGRPSTPDFAGSGGGTANPELVKLIAEGDTSDQHPLSPRNVVRSLYFPSPEAVRDEEALTRGILATHIGDGNYPGDSEPSANWPGMAPGTRGVLNALSPKWFGWHTLPGSGCRAPVLWVRGDKDVIVSDTSTSELGHLGALGYVPGWPGADVYPAQPMVRQTRDVLTRYGRHTEHVFDGTGHFPYTERPEEFAALLHAHLSRTPAI